MGMYSAGYEDRGAPRSTRRSSEPAMSRITILTCLLVGAAIVSPSALAETALQKGVRQYNARQYTEAISTLMAAAQQDGRNPEVHYNLGNAFLQTGDSVRAVREYELGYSLAGSGPVAAYCRSALAGVRQRNRSSMANTTYRTVAYPGARPVIHCPVGTESHHEPVPKGKSGLSPEEWQVFRPYFEKHASGIEYKMIANMVPNWQNLTGLSEMYLYIDRNRKLRARIFRCTTDEGVSAALLEAVRSLDGSPLIDFPKEIKAESFNFYHGVPMGTVVAALRQQGVSTSTAVTMTNTKANLQQAGQSATQGKLQAPAATTAVNASLQNTKVSADVAGKIVGKNTTELKATQQVLPPDTAAQDVKGQIITDSAQKSVSGQLTDTSTQAKIEPPTPKSTDEKAVPAK